MVSLLASKKLIVVGGPTASGKTHCAIQLAIHYRAEVFSADSRQLYREMTIGTAKPAIAEMNGIPHHFIDRTSVSDPYDAGRYAKEMLEALDEYYRDHEVAILCGGTGLYIQALTDGLDAFPEVPDSMVEAWKELLEKEGIRALQDALLEKDPDYYRQVDKDNSHRLIRALSVSQVSGKPYSSYRTGNRAVRHFQPVFLQLDIPRNRLYERIDARVDQMMECGLLEEVRSLLPYRDLKPLKTVGYRELFEYLDGSLGLPEAIQKIKQNTRHYAKRQLTWFRKDPRWVRFHPEAIQDMIQYIDSV